MYACLDVSVDHTLVVEVDESLEHLGDVDAHQALGELAELAQHVLQRTVFDISGVSRPCLSGVCTHHSHAQRAHTARTRL